LGKCLSGRIKMKYRKILKEIACHISTRFRIYENPALRFHNIKHTREVVHAARLLADYFQLDKEGEFIVLAAAWFHDAGFRNDAERHEEESMELAEDYLINAHVPAGVIRQITDCIFSTRLPQHPVTLFAKILCDADLYYLGTTQCYKNEMRLLKEYNATYRLNHNNKLAWLKSSLQQLCGHKYYTDYFQQTLRHNLLKNIVVIKEKIAKEEQKLQHQSDHAFELDKIAC